MMQKNFRRASVHNAIVIFLALLIFVVLAFVILSALKQRTEWRKGEEEQGQKITVVIEMSLPMTITTGDLLCYEDDIYKITLLGDKPDSVLKMESIVTHEKTEYPLSRFQEKMRVTKPFAIKEGTATYEYLMTERRDSPAESSVSK